MLPIIGQVIQLKVESLDGLDANTVLKSRIADIKNKSYLIEIPLDDKGNFRSLQIGDQLSVSYMTEEATYYFHTHVIDKIVDNNIPLLKIGRPSASEISKIQRRSFLRVAAELDVAIRFAGDRRFVAVTKDISGGGMSLIVEENVPLQKDDELDIWLLINFRNGGIEHVPVKGTVVRTVSEEVGLLVMIRFTEVSEIDRQKIVRYCFERQLELRK